MDAPTDAELVTRTLQGEPDAFGTLAQRYYRMISVLALQKTGHTAEAEDIVQESLVRAFRSLDGLRDGEKFGSWLYNICLKLCIDWVRRRQRRGTPVPFDEEVVGAAGSGRLPVQEPVGLAMEMEEENQEVLKAVGELPDRYRLILTLRYVKDLSYRQIAEHLGEPAGTVANRLHRATRMLQRRLQANAPSGEGRL